MALLLRIDVDKPFGHHALLPKLASKLSEETNWPLRWVQPYLPHCHAMIRMLDDAGISAFFYFRRCTAPSAATLQLLADGGHQWGFHAEDTRSFESFERELRFFENLVGQPVQHFTKHGSGQLKLGKHHYAPYEPDRYREWAQQLGIRYFSGNGTPASAAELGAAEPGWWPQCFWLERHYRHPQLNQLEQLVAAAATQDVVMLAHPETWYTYRQVADDMQALIWLMTTQQVKWKRDLTAPHTTAQKTAPAV